MDMGFLVIRDCIRDYTKLQEGPHAPYYGSLKKVNIDSSSHLQRVYRVSCRVLPLSVTNISCGSCYYEATLGFGKK